jgi:hypothetical protein
MEVLILVAVVLAIVLIRGRARKRRNATLPIGVTPQSTRRGSGGQQDDQPKPKPPTFKVVALGLSGSGKTVLLGSMFHQLNFVTQNRSYYLDAAPEQRVKLNTIYRTISDTDQGWPRGTRVSECTEYLFNCIAVDNEGGRHHVLDISYLDYAGELLETAHESGQEAFRQLTEHIGSAQALLGVLDGYRILQLLRGEEAGRRYFEFEVRTMLGLLQSASAPIHLVISKWDLVRGFGEPEGVDDQVRLQFVIDALMRFGHFHSLAYFRREQVVRLIPVSAVGPAFAEIGTNGVVVKRPGAHLQPRNVDVPLSAVVPDLFRQVERSLDVEAQRELNRWRRGSSQMRVVEVLSGIAAFFNRGPGMVLRTVLGGAMGGMGGALANEVGRMFVEWAARPYEMASGRIAAEHAQYEAELGRFCTARAVVLGQFETTVRRLEAVMPNSELGRR